jgi:hypothetical protein
MKQTVEEAAKECRRTTAQSIGVYAQYHSIDECPNHGITYDEIAEAAFIKGAEWQAKQSPWISVKERLPEQNELVLCRMVSNEAIVSGFIIPMPSGRPRVVTLPDFEFEDYGDYVCDMWTPIPSFDEIFEANKDVLERIKEKGD